MLPTWAALGAFGAVLIVIGNYLADGGVLALVGVICLIVAVFILFADLLGARRG